MKNILSKIVCMAICLLLTILVSIMPTLSIKISAEEISYQNREEMVISNDYSEYIANLKENGLSESMIVLDYKDIVSKNEQIEFSGEVCSKLSADNEEVEYVFTVEDSAVYNIQLKYCDLLSEDNKISTGFYFDNKAPYVELENVTFSKVFENEKSFVSFEKDKFGNELRPSLVGKQRFNTEWVESDTGSVGKPYCVFLTQGTHSLKVKRVLGEILISQIVLKAYSEPITYKEYISKNPEISGDAMFTIEAEQIYEVNESTLAPTIDTGNAGMSPVSATTKVVNSFGQNYWNSNGQWGSWKVPENIKPGLYRMSLRVKQNGSVGVTSYRKIYINGEVPFKEAESVGFEYKSNWTVETVGDNTAYYFYLKPGDIITLEATTGEMAPIVSDIYNVLDDLNEIYQSIIVITGTSPDTNRDYNITREIPTLIDDIKASRDQVSRIAEDISKIMGDTNSKVYSLKRFAVALDGYVDNYRTIVPELNTFKGHIDSFAAQTYDFNNMPLELDWICFTQKEVEVPSDNLGFFKSLLFELKKFLYTFTLQYSQNVKTTDDEKIITVWSSLGRDQTQAIKSIIENDFIQISGIKVDLKMTTSSLSEAILAGREPDVALSVTQDVPVDLAMRGQALDLTKYLKQEDQEYMSQFNASSWIPFQYEGGTYAMPITQDYYMMFYRKDILAKLGVEVPQTWDDLYKVIRELQKSNFEVGIRESSSADAGVSSAISIFDMFLYQNGGKYFNDDLTAVTFETVQGKNAFKNLVALYRDFSLDTDFDPLTRFRSGEMPIIITSSTFYQTVSATAREISGKWEMSHIPGTLKSDGTIDRTTTSTVTGAIVLNGAEERGLADEAYEFLSWWVSNDTQFKYITEIEAIQGIAGRSATANVLTFERLSWTEAEKQVLKSQRKWVTAVNQVPGTYIINRSLSNALRTSYSSTAIDPLRQLHLQSKIINEELARKRLEFEKNN